MDVPRSNLGTPTLGSWWDIFNLGDPYIARSSRTAFRIRHPPQGGQFWYREDRLCKRFPTPPNRVIPSVNLRSLRRAVQVTESIFDPLECLAMKPVLFAVEIDN